MADNPNLNNTEYGWDAEGNALIGSLATITQSDLKKSLTKILDQLETRVKYYTTFSDMSRDIIRMLEEDLILSPEVKLKIEQQFKTIFNKEKGLINRTPSKSFTFGFNVKDQRTIQYFSQCNDWYFGKFFQGDQQVRKSALTWMDNYYLQQGNPLGRGTKGITEFRNKFDSYLSSKTDWKARQIIDTTVSSLRNAANVYGMDEAGIVEGQIRAKGDRLTCDICRSYDGRIFSIKKAVGILDRITSAPPEMLPTLKPFALVPAIGKSADLKIILPPYHGHCRCKIFMFPEDRYRGKVLPDTKTPSGIPPTELQKELEKNYKDLTPYEMQNKLEAHVGDVWVRPRNAFATEKEIKQFQGKYIEDHFTKHHDILNEDLGVNTVEEYKQMSYDIIKHPEKVFVERDSFGKDYYVFFRGDRTVFASDSNLSIINYYQIKEQKWIEDRLLKNSAIIQIL